MNNAIFKSFSINYICFSLDQVAFIVSDFFSRNNVNMTIFIFIDRFFKGVSISIFVDLNSSLDWSLFLFFF